MSLLNSTKKNRQTYGVDAYTSNGFKGIHSGVSEREEYIGLAYYQTASPDESTLDDFSNSSGMKRKSTDGDFRAKYKTEICKFWELNKECRYGDNCAFAHGYNDIRNKVTISSNYKTKKCKQFYDNGYCPYGSRCQFMHAQGLTRSNSLDNSTITDSFSYKKVINKLLALDSLPEIFPAETLLAANRPRLKTFTQITQEKIACGKDKRFSSRKSFTTTISENSYSTAFFSRKGSDDFITSMANSGEAFNADCIDV